MRQRLCGRSLCGGSGRTDARPLRRSSATATADSIQVFPLAAWRKPLSLLCIESIHKHPLFFEAADWQQLGLPASLRSLLVPDSGMGAAAK